MGFNPIFRKPNFVMSVSAPVVDMQSSKPLSMSAYRSFCMQLILTDLTGATDGTFQLIASNDEGVTWTPVQDRAGLTYKIAVVGAAQSSFFIFVDEPVAGASLFGLKYDRVAGSGKLAQVRLDGTPS